MFQVLIDVLVVCDDSHLLIIENDLFHIFFLLGGVFAVEFLEQIY